MPAGGGRGRAAGLPGVGELALEVRGGQRVAGARPREALERRPAGTGTGDQVLERAERPGRLARGHELGDLVRADAHDVAQPDADGALRRDGAADGARVDVGRQDLDPAPLRLVDERVGRVETHRLLVEQRAQELRRVVHAQPGRLVGQQPERRAVGLGEAEPREPDDHRPHVLGQLGPDVVVERHRALHEAAVVGLDRRHGALAAHRPAQALRLAGREAGERHRHLDDLVLEDDRPERVAQDGSSDGWS
jgi:hypothetical protein